MYKNYNLYVWSNELCEAVTIVKEYGNVLDISNQPFDLHFKKLRIHLVIDKEIILYLELIFKGPSSSSEPLKLI